jgi:hypothetical protein
VDAMGMYIRAFEKIEGSNNKETVASCFGHRVYLTLFFKPTIPMKSKIDTERETVFEWSLSRRGNALCRNCRKLHRQHLERGYQKDCAYGETRPSTVA